MPLEPEDVAFAARALALKRTVRKGWTRVPGVRDPESVADHSFGVALLAAVAAARTPDVDAARVLTLAVAHDLAEAVTGDLVPGDYADAQEKQAREERGLQEVLSGVTGAARTVLLDAWREYEAGESKEARLVRDLDKLEMALQARVYEAEGAAPADLREFWESALARVEDPRLSALVRGLEPGLGSDSGSHLPAGPGHGETEKRRPHGD